MKKIVFVLAGLASFVALADRIVTYSTARSKTFEVRAMSLADGGCAAMACGEVKDSTGAVVRQSCIGAVECHLDDTPYALAYRVAYTTTAQDLASPIPRRPIAPRARLLPGPVGFPPVGPFVCTAPLSSSTASIS